MFLSFTSRQVKYYFVFGDKMFITNAQMFFVVNEYLPIEQTKSTYKNELKIYNYLKNVNATKLYFWTPAIDLKKHKS